MSVTLHSESVEIKIPACPVCKKQMEKVIRALAPQGHVGKSNRILEIIDSSIPPALTIISLDFVCRKHRIAVKIEQKDLDAINSYPYNSIKYV